MDDYEKQLYGLINRSPEVTGELKGLFDDASTLGVNEIRSGPLLDYGLMGLFDSKAPNRITVDRPGIIRDYGSEALQETLAHESEHARQTQAGRSYLETISKIEPQRFENIMSTAKAHPRGGISVQKQPNILEALAFIRGKESRGDLDILKHLQPKSQHLVDALMYPGYDKMMSPEYFTPTQQPKKSTQPNILDSIRQRIRHFTAQ